MKVQMTYAYLMLLYANRKYYNQTKAQGHCHLNYKHMDDEKMSGRDEVS